MRLNRRHIIGPVNPVESTPFNLLDYFLGEERLREIGERTAIEFGDFQISYNALRDDVSAWADTMSERGLSEGQRVALLLYDSPEFISCFLAAVSLGAVCVPINTFLSADDIAYIISDSGARLVIAESQLLGKLDTPGRQVLEVDSVNRPFNRKAQKRFRSPVAATTRDSAAFLLYTSGSTGTPKGVLHRHGSIPRTVENYSINVLSLGTEDRVYSSSRMFFAYGLGNSLSFPLAAGATVVLDTEKASPEHLTKLIAKRLPTVFFAVPAVYLSILEHRASGNRVDFSGVRLCVSAGEALPEKIFADWQRKFGLTILDGIGSTEMLHIFISNREGNSRAGSSGTVVEGYRVRLSDDEGLDVGTNEPGNLWVRGASAMTEYWNLPEATQGTIVEGWLRTGDVYRRDSDGFFFHIGRSDDCFKVRGQWVSPVEVESVLISCGQVSEAAVVASVDESGLATARAYVVIRQGERSDALREEIRKFAGSRLPTYKVPSQIEFIDEMPRTSTGKVQRYRLRADSRRS